MPRPKKIDWANGATIHEMLRLAMPKKRWKDRDKFYRLLLRDTLHHPANGLHATDDEIEEAIAKNRTMRYEESYVANFVMRLNNKLGGWQREIRHKKASKAALSRWRKK